MAPMDLKPYVDTLQRELAVVTEAAGDEARQAAHRLAAALEAGTRLMLLDALSAASDEISLSLAPGSVQLRLQGGNPSFAVTLPEPAAGAAAEGPGEDAVEPEADASLQLKAGTGATSRINLRFPEAVRERVEEAAAEEGLSVNAWLVRAAAAAIRDRHRRRAGRESAMRRRYVGWVG